MTSPVARVRATGLALLLVAGSALAHPAHDDTAPVVATPGLAVGYGALGFEAPAPGTYRLPPIARAVDGAVLDAEGRPHRLAEFLAGKVVLLSFVYTSCSDVNGCPLATWVLGRVQEPIAANPILRDRVRLLTLSFDPARDSPGVMAEYGSRFRDGDFDWQFLTTAGPEDLDPLLEGYGQYTLPERDAAGKTTGAVAHLLRVYLIDAQGRIRNIYNAGFLHPDILVNDLLTVLSEQE